MVSLYAADWQFTKVDVLKLVAWFDALVGPASSILCVPLFSKLFISRHVVHHLVVHLRGKAAQHEEKSHAIDQSYSIPDLYRFHEFTLLDFLLLIRGAAIGHEVILTERLDDKVERADDSCEEGMHGCVEQEADKVAKISMSNTGSHPWTVMVMNFNAKAAIRAVIRPWWAYNLTGCTIRKLLSQWWVKRLIFSDFKVS